MEHIEDAVASINERNKRVEADKAWETSFLRRFFIAAITYVFASIFLWSMQESSFFLKAIVPTAGYILSTISLPPLKRIWLKHRVR